ncbi:hypothetical protein [Promicromonospora sp. NPDC019610]|uniref:hypothetical protein n=1 Tax=Promicromonospora sp. NPDC019610 TaxID=3364405 RepID=UPI0037A10AA3
MRRVERSLAALVLVSATLASCSSSQAAGSVAWESVLAERAAGTAESYEPFPASLTSAMPSTRYLAGADPEITLSHAVVTGQFVRWAKGTAMVWPEGADDAGTVVDWDAEADTRTIYLKFEVDQVLDVREGTTVPTAPNTITITIGVDGDEPAEAVAENLMIVGEGSSRILFLRPGESGGWTISLDSALIGDVTANGSITMPVLEEAATEDPEGALASIAIDATTLADIEAAASTDRDLELSDG